MKIRQKLKQLERHTGFKTVDQKPVENDQTTTSSTSVPYQKEWEELGAVIKHLDDQYVIVREVVYPLDTQHGQYAFHTLQHAFSEWERSAFDHPLSPEGLQPEQLLFFDTETTGLYTGAGHHIFLLGYAQVKKTGVHVTQYLLPGPESEAALYYHFLSDVEDLGHLVTYNGKAFDWPQVKTRHTFVRDQVPKLPAFGHFDILHASRRLWKNELSSCRLPIVEEHKLRFKRQQDTPSYLVPMLYFDFVKEQDPELMVGVLQHHEWDLLSLITLYSHISLKITNSQDEEVTGNEHYEIGRWFAALGEAKRAVQHLNESICSDDQEVVSKSIYEMAMLSKKLKQDKEAMKYYVQSIERGYRVTEAAIECAKRMEHTYKDLEQAYFYTQVASDALTNSTSQSKIKLEKDIHNRLSRIEKKLRNK
ncbi:ribonuclease H-like domain-containing protein [Alkalicoccobacillus murimartini]|uniref:Uncharacterized protein YprB with RNaseH-like and TPR domain n=1 Tax=Alkalicoccobacillus murimartini TaxID=171685 RepID=A0ABT9YDT6_9BACI|nr:ribonuclease H-like domain-containing protein [Alkalicoccobacillus murimartini]MDQ0206020.1 uncharacterized protein YprB with RNaseH-like and TPR domain [Alkalicoccobacillus murimartini]